LLKNAVALLKSLASGARLPLYAWLSLISQVLIVVTGGLVRLTASGLGCPTWPKCTADSLTTVPAQGYHGVIEFGNRLLTFALLVIAVLTLISVLRSSARKQLRLTIPSVILFLGIPAQAVLGGFTVLTHLNPWLVGSHFVLSGVMIAFASVLVWRVKQVEPQVVPQAVYSLSPALTVFGAIAVVVGVLVTGAGPHSGDASSVRNGLNLDVWQHYHSYPAYAMLALIAVQLVLLARAKVPASTPVVRVTVLFLAVTVVQAVIGVVQARLGVPPLLVGLHMAGAATLCSLITFNYLATRAK
jgi:cytochrome c oxidase assembly protein subunit 15